jgi:hypothetical protein
MVEGLDLQKTRAAEAIAFNERVIERSVIQARGPANGPRAKSPFVTVCDGL